MSSSVKKAFDIIRYVAAHQGEMTLSELGRRLGMNKTTIFRYLETLESLDILEKRDGSWYLGMELFSLGHQVDLQKSIIERVHPIIFSFSRRTNETLSFAGLIGGSAIYLDKVESSRGLQMRAHLGDRLPFHSTALGKSILSVLPEYKVTDLLGKLNLERFTDKTITDKSILLKQVELIKSSGYSLEEEELEHGLSCIAVPLYIKPLNFYGAVSFSGTSSRFTGERMMELVKELKHLSAAVRAKLESRDYGGSDQ